MKDGIFFGVAIGSAALCLLAYLVLIWKAIQAASKADKAAGDVAAKVAEERSVAAAIPVDLSDLVKSLATLVESLVKGGPALWSLIGSLLFLVIAGFAAGIFTSPS